MRIAIASDHAGVELKNDIIKHLTENGHSLQNFGTDSNESCDYPDYAYPAAVSVANGDNEYGILICGSGVGVSIVANKVKGVRCANCFNQEMASLARQHNNANMIAIGARFISPEQAKEMIEIFLETKFEGGRHENRVNKIHTKTGV